MKNSENPYYFCFMNGFLKTFFFLLVMTIIYSCEDTSKKTGELSQFIPEGVSVVFKIQDFEVLKTDIKINGFLSQLRNTTPYSFFKENALLKYLQPDTISLVCISQINNTNHITFITKPSVGLFNLDSIPEKIIARLPYKKNTIQQVTINDQQLFTTIKDSVFIASSSQQIIKNSIDGHYEKDPIFHKIYHLKTAFDFTSIFPVNQIPLNETTTIDFASWASLDIEVLPDALIASGVVLVNDSIPQVLSVFKNLVPQRNEIAKITPTDAISVISLSYNDFDIFQKNIQQFRAIKMKDNEGSYLYESINEVSKIELLQGNAMVLNSIDPSLTDEALAIFINPLENFKGVEIHQFTKPDLFSNLFSPLLADENPNIVFKLDHFFIFSESIEIAKHIINSFLSNNCLATTTYYKEALSQLSDESSLLIIKLNGNYTKAISSLLGTPIESISFKKYPLVILQFSFDRDFAHVNLVCKEASRTKKQVTQKVAQVFSIQLEEDIMGEINFFSNHRTGGKDIVVQDVANKLYFISSGGKTLWTKKLEGPILGNINEVDLLRNGKKQIAFATKSNVYVLDRTGRNVDAFPIKFKDDITQPLSVFDYDNNRKYRFLITQGNEVFMVNSKGKRVKGFKFNKTNSDIVLAPQHIRLASKDYILIAEKSGKLNILNRIGNPRITISKTFDFSEIPIALEGKKFVVITKNNTKHSISQEGKIASLKLNVTAYWFTIKGKTKVTLDDNLMRINGKLVELPFGIYTAPKIFIANQRTYISITETQENKVYLYNKLGELINGFPLFGTSTIDLGDATKNGKANIVAKGGSNNILLYEIQ